MTALSATAVRQAALDLGFARVGLASVAPLPHERELRVWVEAGMAAGMGFMARTLAQRCQPTTLLSGARTAIVVAASHIGPEDKAVEPGHGRVARFARGQDYHQVLYERLERLADRLGSLESRIAVDTSPLLERELAMRAGVGFIGKNTMLITPGLGSYTVLGTLLVDQELAPDPPERARCGRCDLCIRACPTGALRAPFQLDARRCISYLTIEHRDTIDEELRPLLAPWVFGCDACQEVCPYNARAGRRGDTIDPDLAPPDGLTSLSLVSLLRLRSGAYRRLVRGSALRRVSRDQLIRNAALVAGGGLDEELREALAAVSGPLAGEAARWALGRGR